MTIETHKIKTQDGRVEIFRNNNNLNEFFSTAIHILRIVSFFIIILLGGISLYQNVEISMWSIFLISVMIFLTWLMFEEIRDLIIWLKRNYKPIIIIEDFNIHTINEKGQYHKIEIQNIRSVEGKIYTEIKGREYLKRIYFCEIYLSLKNGRQLHIDVINSSKLFHTLSHESIKEFRNKSKAIGVLIAKRLNVEFFLENKINTVANKE